ncbi:MAG: hypothetical protein AAB483_04120 [Patescibacteria group bacterium]
MKYIIIGVIVIALIGAGFWAGTKSGKTTATPTPSQTAATYTPAITVTTPTSSPLSGDVTVGNRPGNLAPDFRLKDLNGREVSLRDYLGRESFRLVFNKSQELELQAGSQNVILRDPDNTVHRLYGVTSMPYTVNIDGQGIIR